MILFWEWLSHFGGLSPLLAPQSRIHYLRGNWGLVCCYLFCFQQSRRAASPWSFPLPRLGLEPGEGTESREGRGKMQAECLYVSSPRRISAGGNFSEFSTSRNKPPVCGVSKRGLSYHMWILKGLPGFVVLPGVLRPLADEPRSEFLLV